MVNIPRLVVAAAASSAGKTTVATGLMAALTAQGDVVAGFKVGPDFIDPGYHALATGRPGRNLDPVLTSEDLVPRLFLHGAATPAPADIAVVEGVMGLFDGRLASGGFGSTAHVARLLAAPVLLVVDAAGSSRTAAVAALGLRDFDARVNVAGVVVNRVASPGHGRELSDVFDAAGLPVLGLIPKSGTIHAPSRHLGLVPAAERGESRATVESLAEHIAAHVDLEAVRALAASAPDLAATPWRPADAVGRVDGDPLVGVLAGRAFTFRYAETTELLLAAGCRIVEIDPMSDDALPAGICALYAGGGFPEVHATELGRNHRLRAGIAEAIADGLPTVAECAGQLYLGRHLDGHPMVGALDASARMTPRLTLGYRTATAPADTLLARAGEEVTGHEFHRTLTTPPAGAAPAWAWNDKTDGFSLDPSGLGRPTVHASYLHVHWAGFPHLAERFAKAAVDFARSARAPRPMPVGDNGAVDGIDLLHHGDRDLIPGSVDLAVNVLLPTPPAWLAERIAAPLLGAYPDAAEARAALAERHGVDPSMVLPTAGGAEAFGLVARGIDMAHPMVVHPQFTEPEAALRTAGRAVQRWLLPVATGRGAPPIGDLPAWCDAVFVGNPTNPTGWLHPRDELLAAGEGRLLVVDEAFMDATDEAESLIGPDMPGRLVLRSLSKTWGLAGLRVGYAVGDPELIARMGLQQPPWSVSSGALAAMIATSSDDALAEARDRHRQVAERRTRLVEALTEAGFGTVTSAAPFVLIDTSPLGAGSIRGALAERGYAVRRSESFPGLGPSWIRVKVPDDVDGFVATLSSLQARRSVTGGSSGRFAVSDDGKAPTGADEGGGQPRLSRRPRSRSSSSP